MSHQRSVLKILITVLLLNIAMPALASITAPDDKILICSQNGFKWISADQQELQYLQLAKQLNLDIEAIFGDDIPTTEQPPYGKCVLCFFDDTGLTSALSSEYRFEFLSSNTKIETVVPDVNYLYFEYQRPPTRAPPFTIHS